MTLERRWHFGLLLMALAPASVIAAYVIVSPLPAVKRIPGDEYLALSTALAVGVYGVLFLPIGRIARAILALLYVPATGFLLIMEIIILACALLNSCL